MKYLYLFFAIAIIAVICFSSLPYWESRYPGFMEFSKIPFHISSAVGFMRCGGFTLTNYWGPSFAENMPNTYFPFFQLVELLMLSKGASIYFLSYWLTWIFLPLAFLTMLVFMYSLYGARITAYAIGLLSLSPIWSEYQWMNPPQSLVFILIPLIFLALLAKRYIVTFILILCCMMTHTIGMAILPCLLLYAIHSKARRRSSLILLSIMLFLGLPLFWLIIQRIKFNELSAIGFMHGNFIYSAKEFFKAMFSIKNQNHVFLGWLAFAGLVICYVKRGKFLILPSYFLALLPIALTQQNIRFWGIPAITIFSLLGGVFLGTVHEGLEKIKFGKIIGVGFFISVLVISGILFYRLPNIALQLKIPTFVFLNKPDAWYYPKVYSMKEKERIIELVKEHVAPDESFYIHGSYDFNHYVAANSYRSSFIPKTQEDRPMNIKLIVERFNPPSSDYNFLEKVNEEFDFSAYILKDASKALKVKMSIPLIKTGQIKIVFMVLGALILIDLFNLPRIVVKRRRPSDKNFRI
ncbi:MAG: hypothetical protein A2047_04170 [Omnitrophica bacterium GWA2_41_15]|nr:MAG: hypothetical protein A2047_04170 [Omnitrophica bacterium GWA2_41_15]HAZ10654.1 hypothetical protein [Candidatus Omnitrophota bacterium]